MKFFSDYTDLQLYQLRDSGILDELPMNSEYYEQLVPEFFEDEGENWEERQRFVQILREMLYRDGRTLNALLSIAEIAAQFPDIYEPNGVNALAGIGCYLNCTQLEAEKVPPLIQILRKYASNSTTLATNARACLRALGDDLTHQ
jgi:hypothetical protein